MSTTFRRARSGLYVPRAGGGGSGFHSTVLGYLPAVYGRHGEASGTTLVDSSGNSRNGSYQSVTLGAASLLPSETDTSATYSSTGLGSVGIIPYGSWMDMPTALTLYAVVKFTSTALMAILDRDDGSGSRVWQFRSNAGKPEFIKIGGTGGIVTSTSPSTVNDGSAHHLGATYDGTSIRLYVDGTKVTTTSAPGTLGTAARTLQTGRNTGSNINLYTGGFDDWFMVGSVLSDADFAALYAAR